MRRAGTQRGVALITAMLVVALATTAAVNMTVRQQLDIRRTENVLYRGQALMYLFGMETWARRFLSDDKRRSKIDHLGEGWALHLPPLPIEGGRITGHIEDLQGRFNLHNLVTKGRLGTVSRQRFARLVRQLGLNPQLPDLIRDWQDRDSEPRFPEGAEEDYYLGQTPAYRTPDRPMASPSELRLLKGLTNEDYAKLLPFITAMPAPTPINVNTASAPLLASLADGLHLKDIETLVRKRKGRPWKSVQDFLAEPVFAGRDIPADGLSVASDYFLIDAGVTLGQLERRLRSIVIRHEDGRNGIYLRTEGEL